MLALTLALAAVLAVRIMRDRRRGETLAFTECPFIGDVRITVNPTLEPHDSLPVRKHEETHAAQCRELGPLRYRIRNLTARGRLSLEAPGYCAGARARLEMGMDTRRVRERILDDANAAFAGSVDSATVRAALVGSCPDVIQ